MSETARSPGNQYSFDATADAAEVKRLAESDTPREVSIAGRVMSMREQGQIIFGDLTDESDNVQIVVQRDKTAGFSDFSDLTAGDWIGVTGASGRTKRGEPSVFVDDWVILAESELPLPIKNGLRDPETVARQRYVDLAVNKASRERFRQRSEILSSIRHGLEDRDFTEVETPILQPIYGGAAARPFSTHHNALDTELYLRIAPELYLKRLVVGGMTRVFEIGKVFRNEGLSPRHNPEFTMMEVYAAYWDHEGQMELTEQLVSAAAQKVTGSQVVEYQGRSVDLTPPWPKVPMDRLVSDKLEQEVSVDTDIETMRALCDQNGIAYEDSYGTGKLLLELYEKTVEDELWGPIFVTEYPEEVSPLARGHRDRPGYTERFEGIVGGSELCNGFSELNNAREQYSRFKAQEQASEHDPETMPMDHDYIRALQYGLPPTAGLGIGIDRLVMLITDAPSIKDVILFPTLRPDGYVSEYDNE